MEDCNAYWALERGRRIYITVSEFLGFTERQVLYHVSQTVFLSTFHTTQNALGYKALERGVNLQIPYEIWPEMQEHC